MASFLVSPPDEPAVLGPAVEELLEGGEGDLHAFLIREIIWASVKIMSSGVAHNIASDKRIITPIDFCNQSLTIW